jgi:hypothetical protein
MAIPSGAENPNSTTASHDCHREKSRRVPIAIPSKNWWKQIAVSSALRLSMLQNRQGEEECRHHGEL